MRTPIRILILGAVLLAGCSAPADLDDLGNRKETWRFAIEETTGSVQDAYAQRFAELVEEETAGQVDVIVYPYGALGTSDHITEQLHNGTLELAMSSPGHLGKLLPEVQAFLLHFLLSDDQRVNAEALRDPDVRAFLDELYAEKGLVFLTAFGEGWQVWTTQHEVRRPEDFEGMRFRVMTSPLLVAAYEAYGASPTPLPYSQVYSALQLRMIDGQVNPVFAIQEMSFFEVTDWMTFPRHAEFITTVAAHPGFLESLSGKRREMIERILDRLQIEIFETQQRFNTERLDDIRARRPDMQIVRLSSAERNAFRRRAEAVRELYVERVGPRGEQLLDLLDQAVARTRRQSPGTD